MLTHKTKGMIRSWNAFHKYQIHHKCQLLYTGSFTLKCKNPSARFFSILERYIRARPHSDELKITEPIEKDESTDRRKPKSKYYSPNITRGVVPKSAYMNIWEKPKQPENPQFLKIAIIGAPNSGKSSLLNSILNKTISAVSPKINTTKYDITGVYTKDNVQLLFVDAPGIIPSHEKKKFCKELMNFAWKGYEEADLVLLVVDVVKRPTSDLFNLVRLIAPKRFEEEEYEEEEQEEEEEEEENCELDDEIDETRKHNKTEVPGSQQEENGHIGRRKKKDRFVCTFLKHMEEHEKECDISLKENLRENRKKIMDSYDESGNSENDAMKKKKYLLPPVILVLNKIDLCTHNKWANARAKEFSINGEFDNIFFISAKHNKGVEELLNYIIDTKTKRRFWIYPSNINTTLTKVQIIEQLINTYLYCWFNKDVPYKMKHHILSWNVNSNNSTIIEYQILVKNEKVAKMICGVHNKLIINMRKNVSYKLTKLWGHNVYVYIHVKAIQTNM